MKSARRGSNISDVEIVNISEHGFWIFLSKLKSEHFVSFRLFPWFRNATIEHLCDVSMEGRSVIHWNALDVDLDVERIDHPERYPLVATPRRPRKSGARRTA